MNDKKSHYLYIIDAGHGGIDEKTGKYQTAPAKMFIFQDFTIYEGVINRKIAELVWRSLQQSGIDFALVYDDVIDTKLEDRVKMADAIYKKDKRAVYISIHSNSGRGEGFEIFTSPGQTKSDLIADVFCRVYQQKFPDRKFRADKADGDADKEENFYVLRKTDCPAVLVENLFFDNHAEAQYLMSSAGQQAIADCIIACIHECEKVKPI